jgi:hypothetical protein
MSQLHPPLTAAPERPGSAIARLVEPVAEVILAADLPALPDDRRQRVVRFVATRCGGLPSVMRLGVAAIASLYRAILALPGGDGVVRWLSRHPLPILGEYPRLIRSLGFALVWETWPATKHDGAPS